MELDGFKDLEQQRQAREDFFEKSFDPTYIEKGKRGGTGEIRQWKDGKYQKQSDGTWKPVKGGGGKTAKDKPVGSIHEHNGKKYKKQVNGKWLEVSESHSKTWKEHERIADKIIDEGRKTTHKPKEVESFEKEADTHYEYVYKLSDKEYTDEEMKHRIGDHKFKQGSIGGRVKITRQGEGEIKGQDKQGRFIIEMDNGEVKILPKGGFKFINKEHTDEEVGLGSKKEDSKKTKEKLNISKILSDNNLKESDFMLGRGKIQDVGFGGAVEQLLEDFWDKVKEPKDWETGSEMREIVRNFIVEKNKHLKKYE